MNDRIRDLALDAIVENIAAEGWVFTNQELQRFAESIVRECADIASINQFQSDEVGNYVRKHFGVE